MASSSSAASVPAALALKIRTLDQQTYPIVISCDASVPQLKEIIAIETGVGLARQRLIFRGKVLKDDQKISAYALEEGHVLHLVVRAEDAVPAPTTDAAQDAQRQQPDVPQPQRHQRQYSDRRGSAAGGGASPARRNNDDPDPTVGRASPANLHGHHVVMGATIAVPEDIPMPFLSSVIANFMNTMGAAAVNGGDQLQGGGGGGGGGADRDVLQVQRSRDVMRRLRRGRQATETGGTTTTTGDGTTTGRRRERHAAQGGSNAGSPGTGGVSLSALSNSAMSGPLLRDFANNHLRRLGNSISNPAFALPEIPPREEQDQDQQGDASPASDDAVIGAQLRLLQAHIATFTPRLDRLPAALREISWYAQHDQEAPIALVSATVRAIDSLQNVGDSATAIARFARHFFLSNSPDIPPPLVRIDDRGTLRASMTFPMAGHLPRGSASMNNDLPPAPRSPSTATATATGSTNTGSQEPESPGVLRSLYQRVTSGLLGTSLGAAATAAAANETTATPVPPPREPQLFDDTHLEGREFDVNHFTISAHAIPFHTMFPLSLPGGGVMFPPMDREATTNRPEWDVAALWHRLTRDLRATTVFGILRGDPMSLYELMRSLATLFVSGLYTPSMTSTAIRLWARRFVIAVRRELREQTFPSQLIELMPDRDQSRFIEEITRSLDPFMPELVDHIRRSNAASQGDVFGRSCTDFFRSMATQFLSRVRTYMNETVDDDAQTIRLLEGLLVALDVEAGLATYVVARFLEFASPSTGGDRTRRTRGDNDEAPPEPKRRRVVD